MPQKKTKAGNEEIARPKQRPWALTVPALQPQEPQLNHIPQGSNPPPSIPESIRSSSTAGQTYLEVKIKTTPSQGCMVVIHTHTPPHTHTPHPGRTQDGSYS